MCLKCEQFWSVNRKQCICLDPVSTTWFSLPGKKKSFIAKFYPTYKISISVVMLLIKKLSWYIHVQSTALIIGLSAFYPEFIYE